MLPCTKAQDTRMQRPAGRPPYLHRHPSSCFRSRGGGTRSPLRSPGPGLEDPRRQVPPSVSSLPAPPSSGPAQPHGFPARHYETPQEDGRQVAGWWSALLGHPPDASQSPNGHSPSRTDSVVPRRRRSAQPRSLSAPAHSTLSKRTALVAYQEPAWGGRAGGS